MKKNLIAVVFLALPALFVWTIVGAQPTVGISKEAPLTGGGSSGDKLRITACSSGSGYVHNGTSWACSLIGDITGVTAGSGLTGTATSGAVSLDVGATSGGGLTLGADSIGMRTDCASTEGLAWDGDSWECAELGGSCTDLGGACGANTDCCSGYCDGGGTCAAGSYANDDTATPTWTGTVNDYALGADVDTVIANLSGNATLTGMSGCTAGREVDLVYSHATASGDTLTVANLDAGSTLGNRFFYDDGSITLDRGSGVHLRCASVGGSDVTNGTYWIVVERTNLSAGDTLGPDGDKGDVTVGGTGTTLEIDSGVIGPSELEDDLDLSGNGTTTVGDFRGTVQTVSTTGTINDLALDNDATVLVLDGAASTTLNGITGGADGRRLTICSTTSTASSIALANEAGGSTAGNRIQTAQGLTQRVRERSCVETIYIGAASRWQLSEDNYMESLTTVGNATISGNILVGATATFQGGTIVGNAWADDFDITSETMYQGNAPTLSGCSSSCTMESYSTNHRGRITCTDDSGSDCTVTFADSGWETNPPACSLTFEDATAPSSTPYVRTVSTTAFSFDQNTTGAHAYSYHCDGMI